MREDCEVWKARCCCRYSPIYKSRTRELVNAKQEEISGINKTCSRNLPLTQLREYNISKKQGLNEELVLLQVALISRSGGLVYA